MPTQPVKVEVLPAVVEVEVTTLPPVIDVNVTTMPDVVNITVAAGGEPLPVTLIEDETAFPFDTRLCMGLLLPASAVLYTVPSGYTAKVKNIIITNHYSDGVNVSLSFAATPLIYEYIIPANNSLFIRDMQLILHEEEQIEGNCEAAAFIAYYICGIEVENA